MNENYCELPDSIAEPCLTHGSVMCHGAPNLSPSQSRHLLSWDNGKGEQEKPAMTPDEAFMSIPPECKTGRYRGEGPARLGGGDRDGYTPRRRADVPAWRVLMSGDTGYMIAATAILAAFAIALFVGWFLY